MAAADLRRRVGGVGLHGHPQRRVVGHDDVHGIPVHDHRADQRQGLHLHRRRRERRGPEPAERAEQHRAPRHPAARGHRRADGDAGRRQPDHRVGHPRRTRAARCASTSCGCRRRPGRAAPSTSPASSRQTTVTGLDNEAEQSVQVQAWNELGAGPFGPSVTMQSAGTPPALPAPSIAASGPGPGGRLGDPDASRGSRAGRTGRRSPATPSTARSTAAPGASVATTSPDVRTARDVIPYDGRTYRYVATVTNGADLESPKANPSSFTSNGIPSTPSVSATTPASNREIRLTVNVGQPRAAELHGHPVVGRRQVRHPRLRLRARLAGRVLGRAVRHQPDEELHDHRVDGELRWRGVEPGQRLGDPLRRHADPDRLRGSRSGTTITWRGTCPTNGRTDRPGAGSRRRRPDLRLGPHLGELQRPGGPAPTSSRCARTRPPGGRPGSARTASRSPNPPPEVYNVHKGPGYRPTERQRHLRRCRPARGSTSTCATSRRRRTAGRSGCSESNGAEIYTSSVQFFPSADGVRHHR